MTPIAVAIDGPSGAGKSTIAKAAAARLGFIYVDTGALYRAIGLFAQRRGVQAEDADAIAAMLPDITLALQYVDGAQRVILCGEDVSEQIRTSEIAFYASKVSAVPAVRAFLLDTQRSMAKTQSVIMDGRDIGTVVLPDAAVKIFLTASAQCRAERRHLELTQKGERLSLHEVLRDVEQRDMQDSTREIAPLRQAEDATLLCTDALNLEESIDAVIALIEQSLGEKHS